MIRGLGEDEEMKEEIYERSEAIAATNRGPACKLKPQKNEGEIYTKECMFCTYKHTYTMHTVHKCLLECQDVGWVAGPPGNRVCGMGVWWVRWGRGGGEMIRQILTG